jgi:hypothetical protein
MVQCSKMQRAARPGSKAPKYPLGARLMPASAEPAPEPTSHAPGEADGGAAAPRKERQSLGPLRMVLAALAPIRGGWRWRAGADRHGQHHGGVPYGFRRWWTRAFPRQRSGDH